MFVKIEGLSAGYNGKSVISGIDVSLEKGELLSVIGANGSGKSTFLKTISGQLNRISGKIYVDGKEISTYSAEDRAKKMSVLLTDRINPEYMTGREIVETGRYPYTGRLGLLSDIDRKKVDEAIELTDTREISEKPFINLSDGEKQRLLFARAVCQEPELLIMDEPMSYLDIKYKLSLVDILKRLCRERQITVIMSIHEAFMAGVFSDKLLCFKEHKVFGYGEAKDIFKEDSMKELYDIDDEGFAFLKSGYMIE